MVSLHAHKKATSKYLHVHTQTYFPIKVHKKMDNYDKTRMIYKILTSSDTCCQGTIRMAKKSVEQSLINHMSDDLKRSVCEERETLDVVLHNVSDGNTYTYIRFKLTSKGYYLKGTQQIISDYGLNVDDVIEFYPPAKDIGVNEQIIMGFDVFYH